MRRDNKVDIQVTAGQETGLMLKSGQFSAMLDLSPDPIAIYQGELIRYANPACAALVGAAGPAEIIGQSILPFIHPAYAAYVLKKSRQLVRQRLENGEAGMQWLRKDGSSVPVHVRASAIVYDGQPAIMVQGRDITELKLMEQSMKELELQYFQMIERSPDAICIHVDNKLYYVNESAARMFRAPDRHSIIGTSILDRLQGDQHAELERRIGQVEADQSLEYTVYKCLRFDGEVVDVEVNSAVIHRHRDKRYIQTVMRDITNRVKRENELRESSQLYQRIIEFLPEPLVVTENGVIVYANLSALRLVKLEDRSEAIGKSIFAFFHPEHHADSERTIREVMATEAPSPFQGRKLLCPNGETVDIEISSIRIDHYMGKSVLLSVLRDLTARKHEEEFIVQTEKLSVIGQLAAGVAHEIRNPLTTLKGFTKLLQREVGDRYPYLPVMEAELDRINFIVNEFMSLSKPHLTQFRLSHVGDIVRSVIHFLEAQANLINVSFHIQCEEQLPPIECDENQLKQVFINVIKNAMDAMPEGGHVRISVSFDSGSGRLCVKIKDDGPGIDEKVAARLGEPFFTTKATGTGLGLMICKRIIAGHGGTLSIGSTLGAGTTVTIMLPLEEQYDRSS
jgi:PAS domain S-box-containing protein